MLLEQKAKMRNLLHNSLDFPEQLKELLEDSNIYKAGVSIIRSSMVEASSQIRSITNLALIKADSKKLARDYGVSVHSCIELSFFAKCIDRQRWKGGFQNMIGLSRLVQAYLLKSLPKGGVQTSNWELKLSQTQQTCQFFVLPSALIP